MLWNKYRGFSIRINLCSIGLITRKFFCLFLVPALFSSTSLIQRLGDELREEGLIDPDCGCYLSSE